MVCLKVVCIYNWFPQAVNSKECYRDQIIVPPTTFIEDLELPTYKHFLSVSQVATVRQPRFTLTRHAFGLDKQRKCLYVVYADLYSFRVCFVPECINVLINI